MGILAGNYDRYFQAGRFLTFDIRNIVLQTVSQIQVYVHSTSNSVKIPGFLSQLSPYITYLCQVMFKIRYTEAE